MNITEKKQNNTVPHYHYECNNYKISLIFPCSMTFEFYECFQINTGKQKQLFEGVERFNSLIEAVDFIKKQFYKVNLI